MTDTILIVEDSEALSLTYADYLAAAGYATRRAADAASARGMAADCRAILLDLNLPDAHGLDFLAVLRRDGMSVPVVVLTAETSVETAVAAIRAGAADFISKPVTPERLALTLGNAIEKEALKKMVRQAGSAGRDRFCDFIGRSSAMQAVYHILESAAASRAPVFISGESGTGKELAARAVHQLGQRRQAAFEALNCAAIPATLLESEMFGHVRGAFTGAVAAHRGAAERADGGTLFLDELTEMPADMQSKMLRFTQSGTFRPVGGLKEMHVDVRFVAATNRDPKQAMDSGQLREDLYYRLNVIPVHLPPLRARGEDAVLIAQDILARAAAEEKKAFAALSDDAQEWILAQAWPGNVRQLQNSIRRAVVMHHGDMLTADMLRGGHRQEAPAAAAPVPAAIVPLDVAERQTIENALHLCGGNISVAARRLGVNPSTLHRKLKKWKLSGT